MADIQLIAHMVALLLNNNRRESLIHICITVAVSTITLPYSSLQQHLCLCVRSRH